QLLTENLFLAVIGGACGILFARWAAYLLILHAPIEIPMLQNVSVVNSQVLAFAAGITILSALFAGLAPAINSSGVNLQDVAIESNRVAGGHQKTRFVFVALNISLALVLLTATGLVLQSVRHLLLQKLGFQPEQVLSMKVSLAGPKYDD